MKKFRALPGFAALPKAGCILNVIAAGMLLLATLAGLLVESAVFEGANFVIFFAAALLLLLMHRKGNPVVLYRWSCVIMAFGFYMIGNAGMTIAALLMFIASFNLRTDPKLENVPGWMRRPVWSLFIAAFSAITALDVIAFAISVKYLTAIVPALPIIAVILLCLACESITLPAKKKQPRLQSVPMEGKLTDIALLLLLVYVVLDFFNKLKLGVGIGSTDFIASVFMNPGFMKEYLFAFIRFIPDVIAIALLLNTRTRRDMFPMAVFLLLINRVESNAVIGSVAAPLGGATIPLVILLAAAIGAGWNKPVGKRGLSVISLILVIALALGFVSSTMVLVDDAKDAAKATRNYIEKQVRNAAEAAVYKEVTGKTMSKDSSAYDIDLSAKHEKALSDAVDEVYEHVYDAVYDAAFKAAKEAAIAAGVDEEEAEEYAGYVAEDYASYETDPCYYAPYYIYEELITAAYEIPVELIVSQELTGEEVKQIDLKEDVRKTIKKEFDQTTPAMPDDGGIYADMEKAAVTAVSGLAFELMFEESYSRLYEEIYIPCDTAANEAALAEIAEHKGEVAESVIEEIIPYAIDLLLSVALLLMCFGMELREGGKIPNRFMAVLNWCYTNVGEKLQRCMKVLGGLFLITGAVGVMAEIAAVVMFFRAELLIALGLAAGGVACIIVSAMNIIFTYPLFGFAQLTADVRQIKLGAGRSSQIAEAEVFEEAEVSEENPDGLPEL